MDIDYDELARKAREAQGGVWRDPVRRREYIAAASPDVILALLEERKVLRERLTDTSGALHRTAHLEFWLDCKQPRCAADRAALQAEPVQEGAER